MITVPIVPSNPENRALYFTEQDIPDKYMEDYSKIGFMVERYEDSIALLLGAGYRLQRKRYGASLQLEDAMGLAEVRALLHSASLYCEYGDIADTFYQA